MGPSNWEFFSDFACHYWECIGPAGEIFSLVCMFKNCCIDLAVLTLLFKEFALINIALFTWLFTDC